MKSRWPLDRILISRTLYTMADQKLPLTDFQNVVLGSATLLAFGAGIVRTKKIPNIFKILSLGGALQPLASVNWPQVVPEALDMDAAENQGLKNALNAALPDVEDAKIKDLVLSLADISAPAVDLYGKGKKLIDAAKAAFGQAPAAPATK